LSTSDRRGTLDGMTSTARRPYHHGDLRRAVVQTAMAMLDEEKGWQFTLREVARRAGVSHAAPYKHFPDKAALLGEIAMAGFERLREALRAAQRRRFSSARQEFLALGQAYIRFGAANPALYRLMFGAEVGTRADTSSDERPLAAFGVILDMLERGQQAGDWRKRNIQGQAAACWAQVHGLTMLTIDGLLQPRKLGAGAAKAALTTLLEGLAT
jgi:AcrR family transcriptional regulator